MLTSRAIKEYFSLSESQATIRRALPQLLPRLIYICFYVGGYPGNSLISLATPAGFEPATCRLEGGCSIQLSYGAEPGLLAAPLARQCDQGTTRFGAKLSE
jgi:hypothetical protein